MLIKDLFNIMPSKKDEYWKYSDFSCFNQNIESKTKFSLRTNLTHSFIDNNEFNKFKDFFNINYKKNDESYNLHGDCFFDLTLTSGIINKNFIINVHDSEYATLDINIKTSKDFNKIFSFLNFNIKVDGFLNINLRSNIEDSIIFEQFNILLGENAKLNINYISSGSKFLKSFFYIKQFKKSYLDFKYRSFLLNDKNSDLTIVSESIEENCFSNHDIKCVLNNKSKFSCTGEIIILKNANNAEASHYNSTLALSNDVKINSRPILKISNGNVKCSHGSPSFYIRDEDIFYMCSRGLNKKEANKIYIKSFLNNEDSIIEDLINKGV